MVEIELRADRFAEFDTEARRTKLSADQYTEFRAMADSKGLTAAEFDTEWEKVKVTFPGQEHWDNVWRNLKIRHMRQSTAQLTRSFLKAMLGSWKIHEPEPKPEINENTKDAEYEYLCR